MNPVPSDSADQSTPASARAQRWHEFHQAMRPRLRATAKFTCEEPLAVKTTIRIGGSARLYAEPGSEEDMRLLLTAAATAGIAVLPLGRGSNLIVPDAGVEALVISMAHENWAKFEPRPDGAVWVGAGLRLKNLCGLAAKAAYSGARAPPMERDMSRCVVDAPP